MLKSLLEKYKSGTFISNVLTMVLGSSVSQAVTILSTVVLVRLYSVEEYGQLGLYNSIVSISAVFVCLRYELSIILPEKYKDAANLLVLSVLVPFTISILTLLGMFFFRNSFARILGDPTISPLLWLLPLSFLFTGCYQAFEYWSTRKQYFKKLAVVRILKAVLTVFSQLVGGFFISIGAVGLIGGLLAGQLIAVCILGLHIIKKDKYKLEKAVTIGKIKQQAVRYRHFPMFNMWPSFLDAFSLAVPVLFFSNIFGVAIAGYYTLALRITSLPLTIIGSSVTQVFLSKLSQTKNENGRIDTIVIKMFKKLSLIGFAIFILLQTAPWIIPWVLGEKWKTTGVYAQIMALPIALKFIIAPLSYSLIILEKHKEIAGWKIFYITVTILFLAFSSLLTKPYLSLIILSISDVICYLVYLYLIFKTLRDYYINNESLQENL